jgi:hypothetical protein
MIVTVANRDEPGLLATRDTWFFKSIVDEISEAERAGPAVVARRALPESPPEGPTADWVRGALECLEVRVGSSHTPLLTDFAEAEGLDFARIAERVLSSDG